MAAALRSRDGVFLYAPISVLALRARMPRERQDAVLVVGVTGFATMIVLVSARHGDWWGGEPYLGSRYLVPAIPFLWLVVVEGQRRVKGSTFEALAALSVFAGWVGAQYGEHGLLHVIVLKFLLRGVHFPLLDLAAKLVKNRSEPVSATGLALVLCIAVTAIWTRKPLLERHARSDAFPPGPVP